MTIIRRRCGGDEPVGQEPGETVTTGEASVKSSAEESLPGSFANLMCRLDMPVCVIQFAEVCGMPVVCKRHRTPAQGEGPTKWEGASGILQAPR